MFIILFSFRITAAELQKRIYPHIFERFYHGKNSSSESVGIGLALAKPCLKRKRAILLLIQSLARAAFLN